MKFFNCVVMFLILGIAETDADIPTFYLDTELCNQRINMSSYNTEDLHSFHLKLSEQHYYPHNLDCQLQIQAQRDSEHIMFYFKYFDVRPEMLPEYCNYDWLEIHDGNSTGSPYVCGLEMKLCGISPSRTMGVYFTRNNDLTLYFKSDAQEKYTGFDMVITRFRYGQCRSDEHACANGRCIDQSLQCNGYNPCGDGSDCTNLHPGYIISIVAAALIVLSLVANIILGIMVYKTRKSKIVPHDKTPLNTPVDSGIPGLQESSLKYGTVRPPPRKLPSESTDHTEQVPFILLEPPCTTILSQNDGKQSPTVGRKPNNPKSGKNYEHVLSNGDSTEPKLSDSYETDRRLRLRNQSGQGDCVARETDYKQGFTNRSRTEPIVCSDNDSRDDQQNTHPKRVCSCGSRIHDISGFEFRKPYSSQGNRLDSGYNTTRLRPFDSQENTHLKLPYCEENTVVKRLHGGDSRMQGTPVRAEVDCDEVDSFQTSVN